MLLMPHFNAELVKLVGISEPFWKCWCMCGGIVILACKNLINLISNKTARKQKQYTSQYIKSTLSFNAKIFALHKQSPMHLRSQYTLSVTFNTGPPRASKSYMSAQHWNRNAGFSFKVLRLQQCTTVQATSGTRQWYILNARTVQYCITMK
ncbi:hypothetical protein MTO96_010132 [Rhipicephalus appendiculatus]